MFQVQTRLLQTQPEEDGEDLGREGDAKPVEVGTNAQLVFSLHPLPKGASFSQSLLRSLMRLIL